MSTRNLILYLLLIQFMACKDPYDPSTEAGVLNYLVVDGFINLKGVSTFKLTRTLRLAESGLIKNEAKSVLQIEGEDSSLHPLREMGDGIYESSLLNLPFNGKYRLRIKTSDGKEYLSGYESGQVAPPVMLEIDKRADGIMLSASSNDPQRSTNYYQWRYVETSEILSSWYATYRAIPGPPASAVKLTREQSDEQYNCWETTHSSNILIATTLNLSESKISNFPLVFIPTNSEKIAVRYSLFAQQLAISKEAYIFFELMKKTSEQMGSVFDPLPSTIHGNITCINDKAQLAIGFVVAASASEKRIFISNKDVPDWKYSSTCDEAYVNNTPAALARSIIDGKQLTVGERDANSPDPEKMGRFHAVPAKCVDCRLKGGNSPKPAFW